MGIEKRIKNQTLPRAGVQSVKIGRTRATRSGRPIWHGEFENGERIWGMKCEDLCNAIAERAGGESVSELSKETSSAGNT